MLRIGRAQAGFHPHPRPCFLGESGRRGFVRAGLLLAVVGIALLVAGTAQAGTVAPAGRGGSQAPQSLGVPGIVPFAHPVTMAPSPGSVRPAFARPAALATPPPITSPTATDPATAPPAGGGTSTDPWRWWLVGVMVILAGFFLLRGLRRQRGR